MTGSLKDMIRIKKHAINLFLFILMWVQNTVCFSMINFYTKRIPGDKYSNILANCLVEIPAYAIGGVFLKFLGMRITNYIGASVAVIGGVLLIMYGEVNADGSLKIPQFAYVFIVLSAKGGVLMLINTSYIGTATMFPPVFSGAAFGMCNTFAKLAAMSGPLIAELKDPIPSILFTSLTCFIFPLTFFLKIRKSKEDSFS